MTIGGVADFDCDSPLEEKNFKLADSCHSCTYFVLCRGNCPLENKIKRGTLDTPVCRKNEFEDLINFIIEKNSVVLID